MNIRVFLPEKACFLFLFNLSGLISFSPFSDAMTSVSRVPALDYASGMSQFISVGEDILVFPQLEYGKIWQLDYDGWQWIEVAEYDTFDWLGYIRVYPQWVFPLEGEVLVMDGSPVLEGFRAPGGTILKKVEGTYQPVQSVSLSSKLQDENIYDFSIMDIVPSRDLVAFKGQVNFVGYGGRPWCHTFIKGDEDEWVAGPDREFPGGYWWPLYSQREEDGLHFWHMEMISSYFDFPRQFKIFESILTDSSWTTVRESWFQLENGWNGIYGSLRALLSPDENALLLFVEDPVPIPADPLVFNRDGEQWAYQGKLSETEQIDTTELYLVKTGKGVALMRSGEIASVYGEQIKQRYHVLRHNGEHWQLTGNLTSHRVLTDYYFNEVFYCMGDEFLTIFDIPPYRVHDQAARSYHWEDLSPRLVKWFRFSESHSQGIEQIPPFGYFFPTVSDDTSGIWVWHWNLGWIFISGREENHFNFWNEPFGWSYFDDSLYDQRTDFTWLYSWSHLDYIWSDPDTYNPNYFYSQRYGEWMSSTPAPLIEGEDIDAVMAAVSEEIKETGVTLEVDYENHVALFSFTETENNETITIQIEGPWQYLAGTDYACQARFEMDLSTIRLISGSETVVISSYDLWTEAKLLLPARLEMSFIFYTGESGILIQNLQYNNFTWDIPTREYFGPEG